MRCTARLFLVLRTVFGELLLIAVLLVVPQRGLASGMPVPAAPGVAVSPGYSLDVDAGTVVEYVHTITNTGDVAALFGVQAVASTGWPVDYANAQYPSGTTSLMPFPLESGAAMTVGVRLAVPVGAAGGVVNTTTVTVSVLFEGDVYTHAVVDDIAIVNRCYVYLPLVLRAYDPFDNGDFSDGLTAWQKLGALGVSVALNPGDAENAVALLGDPTYACGGGVPLGFAGIAQRFSVPPAPVGKSVRLQFRYRIYTNDRNIGLTGKYDSFDVLIDDVLKFRDANQKDFDYCNVSPYDLGWRVGEIDLGAGGKNVTLAFTVHNRTDHWYNTYVYVDDVEMMFVSGSRVVR